jgi:hypothetical protein
MHDTSARLLEELRLLTGTEPWVFASLVAFSPAST